MYYLPKGWEFRKINDIAINIQAGGTPLRSIKEYWDRGTIPWLKISDLKSTYVDSSEEKITALGLKESSTKKFPRGTVLYTIFATLGESSILDFEATTNQAIAGIVPDTMIIDTKYLYYCLKNEKRNILQKKSHGTQDNINLSILRNHTIPVPPLSTQRQIVSVLDKAESLRQKRKEASEETNKIIQSLFYEIFGDPIKNERGWEIKKLGDVCQTASGGTPSRSNKEYYLGTIPWIKSGELNREYISYSEEHISELGLKNSSAKYIEPNTVLLAMYGATAGKSAILKISATTNQAVCSITPIKHLNNTFLLHFLKMIEKFIISQSIGGGQPNISQGIIKNINIILPPISLQNQFASIVERIEKIKEEQKQSEKEINELFDALMQKAFRGELVG